MFYRGMPPPKRWTSDTSPIVDGVRLGSVIVDAHEDPNTWAGLANGRPWKCVSDETLETARQAVARMETYAPWSDADVARLAEAFASYRD